MPGAGLLSGIHCDRIGTWWAINAERLAAMAL